MAGNPTTLYVYRDGQVHRVPVTEYPNVVRLAEPSPLLGTATEIRKVDFDPGVALTRQGALDSLLRRRQRRLELARKEVEDAQRALAEVS